MFVKVAYILLVLTVVARCDEKGEEEHNEVKESKSCGLPMRRLPERVRAKHYELNIEPSLKGLTFNGRVRIELAIEAANSTASPVADNQILFHADKGISLDERSIKFTLEGRELAIESVCRDDEFQLVVLSLSEPLPAHRVEAAQLLVSFYGPLRDDMFGFYKSTYLSEDNEKHYLATTQFESTEARKAFPCFDEPSFKATFQLTVVHEPKVVALSNTEVIEEKQLEDGRKWVKFAPTPPMSTYLLAYVIGQFDYIERVALGGRLKVRVYTTPGESHKGQFALDTTCRAIQLMEEYFGIEFPLNKMDLIGIPDFENGAMENWGLITFREVMLLTDELDTTPMDMAEVGTVVIHELAHQWFGNLVTMRWWNDLWLNEGFATWMSYHIMEQVHPQYDTEQNFLERNHIKALYNDATRRTHSIRAEREIVTNEQIEGLFDMVTYEKSASVLSFIHNDYLGPELFRESLRHYMAKHKYGNTVTDDLCASMEEVSKLPVKPILDSWTAQPGHPVLLVDYDGKALQISQKRFKIDSELDASELGQRWLVPVSMVVEAPGRRELIKVNLDANKPTNRVDLPSWFKQGEKGHWLKLNHEFSGFYRTHYPHELIKLLEEPIRKKTMLPGDRLNLANEAHALWKANYTTGSDYIELLTWFEDEDSGVVLSDLVYNLKDLQYVAHKSGKGIGFDLKFESFVKRLLEGHLKAPIFSDKTAVAEPLDEAGLAAVLALLIAYDHPKAMEVALGMYEAAKGDVNQIPVALREPVYLAIARAPQADQEFDQLLSLLKQTRSRMERNRLIPVMVQTPHLMRQVELTEYLFKFHDELKVDFAWRTVFSSLLSAKSKRKEREEYQERGAEMDATKSDSISGRKEKDIEEAVDKYLAQRG